MVKRAALAIAAAMLLSVGSASAGDTPSAPPPAPPAAESSKAPAREISFKRDVKEAWAQAREGGRNAGRAIGDGARSFGRATRDATVDAWHKVKKAFSS